MDATDHKIFRCVAIKTTFTMQKAVRPLITTLIPTYRRPRLLQRALASAAKQQDVDVRVCVFDNCSGDETAGVVRQMGDHAEVRYHCHPRNIGGLANLDFAMRSVETPFFSVLSDDDYLLPGFYRNALAGLRENPQAMFWVGETIWVNELGLVWDARVSRWPREGVFSPPEGLTRMMHGLAPTWTGVVFRREIFDRIGFLDLEALGPCDLDFMLRAASQPFVLSKSPSAVYMINTASFSATQPLSSFWPGWQKLFRNMEHNAAFDPGTRSVALAALHRDAQRMLFRRGVNALTTRRYDFSREAAHALQSYYGMRARSRTLEVLAAVCERAPWLQRLFAAAYRWLERRLVASRGELEVQFGHLVQRRP